MEPKKQEDVNPFAPQSSLSSAVPGVAHGTFAVSSTLGAEAD